LSLRSTVNNDNNNNTILNAEMFAFSGAPGARRNLRIAIAFALALLILVILGHDRILSSSIAILPLPLHRNASHTSPGRLVSFLAVSFVVKDSLGS